MKTKVDFLKDRLVNLFRKEEPFVISLNGEWGVGKTHFWNDFKENYLEKKDITYTSLFGKDNIQSIKMDIILQISKRNEYIHKSKGILSHIKSTLKSKFEIKEEEINLGLTGSVISSFLTLFTKKDFENVIVCLDDFERISKHIDSKDILGFISELKEQKNCKVVLILNQDKVEEETLSTFKDKIIDYELHYLPTPKESYDLVRDKLKYFHKFPLKYFERKDINNIRVMKRVINSLNDFDFVEDIVKGYPLLEQEIVENIIELSTINSISNFKDFEKLKKYSLEKSSSKVSSYGNKEFIINEEYENILRYIDTGGVSYFYISEITNYIMEYIKTSIIDNEPLLKIIEDKKGIQNREEVYKEIHKYYDMFNFNMSYKVEDFVKKLFEIFEVNSDNIVDIVGSNNFIFYIELLKELDIKDKEKYHLFCLELLKKHLVYYIENNDKIWGFDKDKYLEIQKFDTQLEKYVKEEIKTQKTQKISNLDEVINLMRNPVDNRSWGKEPELLSSIEKETIKKFILESQEFVEVSFNLIREFRRNSGSGFDPYINQLLTIFEELKNSNNKDIQVKMTKLLNFFNKK